MAHIERFVAFSILNENIGKSLQKIKAEYMMQEFGLHSSDVLCLVILRDKEAGLSAAELARACKVDRSVISRAVPTLLDRGVIRYKDASGGGRNYRTPLVLTEAGVRMTDEIQAFTVESIKTISGDVDPDELACFYRVFRKLDRSLAEYAEKLEQRAKKTE